MARIRTTSPLVISRAHGGQGPSPEQQVSDYQKSVYVFGGCREGCKFRSPAAKNLTHPGTLPYPYPRVNALDSPIRNRIGATGR
jgi:hypothetical protein